MAGKTQPKPPLPGAQGPSTTSGSLTAQWDGTGTAPAGSQVTLLAGDEGTVSLQITGTFSLTTIFEGTVDNTTWRTIHANNIVADTLVTGATASGIFLFPAGLTGVRVRCSAYTSGTAVITMRATPASSAMLSVSTVGGGGSGGTVNQGTPNAGGASAWPVTLASTLSEANDTVSGHIGGYNKVVTLLLTRPANVTPYTAGDEIADTAGTVAQRSFVGAGRVNGGSGTIDGGVLIFSDNPAVTPTLKLYLFDTDPTSAGDNNAYAPTDAQLATSLGVLTFSGGEIGTTGTTGNIMFDSGPAMIDYVCAGGSTTLYFLLVTRTAFTSGAVSSTITLRLRCTQN